MKRELLRLFNLRRDQKDPAEIDAALREGAQFGGTNLWVLFFAILIASVGLNVNSTAVIIGAMLISPLMGPIVGMGYGAAIGDFELIRSAGRNLAIFAVLSLAASTLYFLASPLTAPGSELVARTSPNLWDVLIAAFGGAAGMVAVTRKGYTNVVPGVAIATALMPPLCTVGYGIAHARWDMAGGAFYLFLINGVFIASASLLLARLMRLPERASLSVETRARNRVWMAAGLVLVVAPSIWMAWRMVQDEVFATGAQQVAQSLQSDRANKVFAYDVDPRERLLRLHVAGRSGATAEQVQSLLMARGVRDARVELITPDELPDMARLRKELRDDLTRSLLQQVQVLEKRVQALEAAAPAASAVVASKK